MDNKTDNPELISALADGELAGDSLDAALRAACGPDRATWQAYHLIGDVLRSADLAAATPADRFMDGLRGRLAAEAAPQPVMAAREAANDTNFRWKLVAGFASFAAVAAIGWNVAGTATPVAAPQLAAAPAAQATLAAASTAGGVMLRDPHLDRLLAAHRQLGGATALQTPAGFLRNATFEGPSR